jgi:hypothetical protein
LLRFTVSPLQNVWDGRVKWTPPIGDPEIDASIAFPESSIDLMDTMTGYRREISNQGGSCTGYKLPPASRRPPEVGSEGSGGAQASAPFDASDPTVIPPGTTFHHYCKPSASTKRDVVWTRTENAKQASLNPLHERYQWYQ